MAIPAPHVSTFFSTLSPKQVVSSRNKTPHSSRSCGFGKPFVINSHVAPVTADYVHTLCFAAEAVVPGRGSRGFRYPGGAAWIPRLAPMCVK
jgi:hypothetical protein